MNENATDGRPGSAERTLRIDGAATPVAPDPAKAEAALAELCAAALANDAPRLAAFCERGPASERARLGAVLALSPHLHGIAARHPFWLDRLFDVDAGERVRRIVEDLCVLDTVDMPESALMARLREAKNEASLLIALRDLFGAADARQTVLDLSALAEACVAAALRSLVLDLHWRGKLALPDPEAPETGCGLFVLGMGKLGGRELNYSSDIDLIVLFDPDAAAIRERDEAVETFSRLVRRLVRILAERTGDGYVFRTDLRLRPDPGAMPLAIPVPAALAYYEASGRNWERAAMIKARPVAGDRAAAERFLSDMQPFVWRRYLDFAAVADIRSMKGRIDRHRGFEGIRAARHDVKLGPGGIREVEFFAQGQQLIAGGRSSPMRSSRTDEALARLAQGGWITDEIARRMTEAYWFLRRVEHAVQMVADEQRHDLPADEAGLRVIAGLLGYADAERFAADLVDRLSMVEAQFDQLFRSPDEAEAEGRRLYRLMESANLEALADDLRALGFGRAESSARVLANWTGDRYRAMRSGAARDRLADVLPELLRAFAGAADADGALAAFDTFLAGLPTGVQFFSLLASNPRIADLLTSILTSAPALAATIADRPHVFDAFLDPGFFRERSSRERLAEHLGAFMRDARSYEETLARLRLFAAEQRFLVGARLFSGTIDAAEAGRALSDIADTAIAAAFAAAAASFAEQHGSVPGARTALFGMGRLGSRELATGSDVDLILFYDHPEGVEASNGKRPLPPALYYGRLTQRIIAALSSPMGEGVLYEVDFRLRPSGNMGPLATHLDAFLRYHSSEARIWERMALTRSRLVAGDASLGASVREAIATILTERSADPAPGIAAMRDLLDREKPPRGPLDLKRSAGGLTDIEFLAQWAILTGRAPVQMIGRPTADVLEACAPPLPAHLSRALETLSGVLQLSRLGPDGAWSAEKLAPRLAERIAAAIGVGHPREIEPVLVNAAASVREAFRRLLPSA